MKQPDLVFDDSVWMLVPKKQESAYNVSALTDKQKMGFVCLVSGARSRLSPYKTQNAGDGTRPMSETYSVLNLPNP